MILEKQLKNIAEFYWRSKEIFAERGQRATHGFDAAAVSAIYNDWIEMRHYFI